MLDVFSDDKINAPLNSCFVLSVNVKKFTDNQKFEFIEKLYANEYINYVHIH